MALVGIDVGSLHALMATPQRGTIQVVRNELADRLTPSMVGFSDKQRLLGDAALSQVKSNLKSTCVNFMNVMGRSFETKKNVDDDSAANERFGILEEERFALAKLVKGDAGRIAYQVMYKGKETVFEAPQIAAAFLSKLRSVVEKNVQRAVQEVVVSCPPWYSDANRSALADAVNTSGINCTAIVGEDVATALEYGWYRVEEIKKDKEPRRVVFVSMGHSACWVAVVEYTPHRQLEIISSVSDCNLGGRNIDCLIATHFATLFEKQTGLKPLENPKAKYKLFEQATKAKLVLSANSEVNFHIECLLQDEDCSGVLSRTEFEEMMNNDLMLRFTSLLQKALRNSGFGSEQLYAVEMVGGSSRIPKVQTTASQFFGREVSKTVNADECVARGCCLVGAIISPNFRSVGYTVIDRVSLPIDVELCDASSLDYVEENNNQFFSSRQQRGGEKESGAAEGASSASGGGGALGAKRSLSLFAVGANKANEKRIIVYRSKPFSVSFNYSQPHLLPSGVDVFIGKVDVEAETTADGALKEYVINLSFDLFGRLVVGGVTQRKVVEVEETTRERRTKAKTTTKTATPSAAGGGKKEEGRLDEKSMASSFSSSGGVEGSAREDVDDVKQQQQKNQSTTTSDGTAAGGGGAAEADKAAEGAVSSSSSSPTGGQLNEEEEEEVQVKRMVAKERFVAVKFLFSLDRRAATDQVEEWKAAEWSMASDDLLQAETLAAMNECEAYAYDMRDRLSGQLAPFVDEQTKASFLQSLKETEEWMYSQSEAPKAVFVEKLKELRSVGDQICRRHKAKEEREAEAERLLDCVGRWKVWAEKKGKEFDYIPPSKIRQIIDEANAAERWLSEEMTKQNALPGFHEPPLLTARMIEDQCLKVHRMATEITKEPAASKTSSPNNNNNNAAPSPPPAGQQQPTNHGASVSENDDIGMMNGEDRCAAEKSNGTTTTNPTAQMTNSTATSSMALD